MKKNIVLGLFLIIIFHISYSQEKKSDDEKISFFIDRDLYITGEKILVKLFSFPEEKNNANKSGEIAYLELFNKEKKSILKKKTKLVNNSSELNLNIPENIDSDNYLLVVYTEKQKQFCNKMSAGKIISIINPNYVRFSNDRLLNNDQILKNDKNSISKKINFVLKKEVYNTRSKVDIDVNLSDLNTTKGYNYVISVVKKGAYNNSKRIEITEGVKFDKVPLEYSGKRINLSGKIINKDNNAPVENVNVFLSGLKDEKQLHRTKTDSTGQFSFYLYNFNGLKDYFLCTEPEADLSKINIYNEFLTSCLPEKFPELKVSLSNKSLIQEMFINKQLSELKGNRMKFSAFKTDTLISQLGKPDYKIYLKDFIKLPTLHEVFDELIPSLRVREEKQKNILSIYDEELNLNYNNPLILLDNIPVFDVEEILNIKPSLINSIEIINKKYLIGDNIFNGILILNSNSDKFCRIKLPQNTKFIKYQGFSEVEYPIFPIYENSKEIESKIPDFRNTLYWKTGTLLSGNNLNFNFYTSDDVAEYSIIFYLIDKAGNVTKGTKSFKVEKS